MSQGERLGRWAEVTAAYPRAQVVDGLLLVALAAGLEAQLPSRLRGRWEAWSKGPRPPLSVPPALLEAIVLLLEDLLDAAQATQLQAARRLFDRPGPRLLGPRAEGGQGLVALLAGRQKGEDTRAPEASGDHPPVAPGRRTPGPLGRGRSRPSTEAEGGPQGP